MENIKKILGITELYQLNEKINEIIFNDEQKEYFFDSILLSGVKLETDFIRDLFQEEASARKSFKQDYSPDSICELFSKLVGDKSFIYDECAGTGSLLIPFINKGVKNITAIELSGNVLPLLLFNLSIRNVSGTVIHGDILTNEIMNVYSLIPGEKYSTVKRLENYETGKVQTIISNPPYSLGWECIRDDRLDGFALPPKSKADYLFLLDMLSKLEDTGEAFILLPHGVLFRGASEGEIRKELIERGYLKALIGLPSNMFMNTGIPTVLLHISKSNTEDKSIFIMDASLLEEKSNKVTILNDESINKIVDCFRSRREVDKLCRVVPYEELKKNDFNLNIPRYIDTFEREPLPDLTKVVTDILELDKEIIKTEIELAKTMSQLVGGNYQDEIGDLTKLWLG